MKTPAHDVTHALHRKFCNSNFICLEHAYVWDVKYESDFATITKGLFVNEFEIKHTRSDFLKDFAKMNKHRKIKQGRSGLASFTFVVKSGEVQLSDIPDYCGYWTFVNVDGMISLKEIKRAPKLRDKKKLTSENMFRICKNVGFKCYLKDKETLT